MAKTTIEWADYTFNPWEGCQRIAPECDNCYAQARSTQIEWARSLRDQCQEAGVPFFFKQHDAHTTRALKKADAHDKLRFLDGREWNEMPS